MSIWALILHKLCWGFDLVLLLRSFGRLGDLPTKARITGRVNSLRHNWHAEILTNSILATMAIGHMTVM